MTSPPRTPQRPSGRLVFWTFLLLLLVPGALKFVKAQRITEGRLALADLFRVLAPDAALAAGSALLFAALVRMLQRTGGRVLGLAVLSTAYLLPVLLWTALEHQSWVRTESLLDWSVVSYTLRHLDDLNVVLASETTPGGIALLLIVALLAFLPGVLDGLWSRSNLMAAGPRRRQLRLWTAATALLCAASLTSPRAAELHPIAQSATLGLLRDMMSASDVTGRSDGRFTPSDAAATQAAIQARIDAASLQLTTSESTPRNVLLVVMESTRFDATTPYVPELPTTPRLGQLASEGVRVDNALALVTHTSKALVSILCGYSPRFSVEINEAELGGLPNPCLPHLLGRLGYRNAFFQAADGKFESRGQLLENMGFDEFYARGSYEQAGFEEVNYLAVEDKIMAQPVLRWIRNNSESPFFLTLLTCSSHHAYGLPNNFAIKKYKRRAALKGNRTPRPWSEYNRYLNTLRYTDELLGEVLDGLRQQGVLEDTLIVVVGDHGQAFGEHGQRAHNTVTWQEGLRVPLILHNRKAIPEPRKIRGLRSQVDIAPTVLKLLGASHGGGLFDGRDLLRGLGHKRHYSSCWYDERCRAETSGHMRIVDHFKHRPMEVYDLKRDPLERKNLLKTAKGPAALRWANEALAARGRMDAHQQRLEERYRGSDEHQPWLLTQAPSPANPLPVLFGHHLELLGYDTPSHTVKPGDFWDAVVYFKCLERSKSGWRLFTGLETVDGRFHQVEYNPANGRYYLDQCEAGTYVADHVRVWIPDNVPPGPLDLYWGSVYLKEKGRATRQNPRLDRRPVKTLRRGIVAKDKSVRLAKLDVKSEYRQELAELLQRSVTTEAPELSDPIHAEFGGALTLLQAKVTPDSIKAYGSGTIEAVWRVDETVGGPWQVFVKLRSLNKKRSGYGWRKSHTPVDGMHPVANWQAGTYVKDTFVLPVPMNMPAGEAEVWIGLNYDRKQMRVSDPGGLRVRSNRRLLLGTVTITR